MLDVTAVIHRKQGMVAGVTFQDNRSTSPTFGLEISIPVTNVAYEQCTHDHGIVTINMVAMRVRFDEDDA